MLHVRYDGTIAIIIPDEADRDAFRLWIINNIRGDYEMFGEGLVVELRYLEDTLLGLADAGFDIDA